MWRRTRSQLCVASDVDCEFRGRSGYGRKLGEHHAPMRRFQVRLMLRCNVSDAFTSAFDVNFKVRVRCVV